jgi:hypothetical protein
MEMSELLASLVNRFGKDSRVYSVSFDEQGFWHIGITDTGNGEVLARYTNAHVRT